MSSKQIGDNIIAENASWNFKGVVAQNFDEHIQKSVPLYALGHQLIAQLSDFFLSDGSLCYDLGCATGSLLQQLNQRNSTKKVNFQGIDQEKDMADIAKKRCKDDKNIKISCVDLLDVEFEPADLIIAYYTIQFIKPKNRQLIIDRIYQALNWGGAFVMFEKVRAPDARFQDIASALYVDYKLGQGYSQAEIIAKNRSLKGVVEPFSTQGNLDLLKRAGFVDVMTIQKQICFEGFLAIK
jgi:tRNA (cmo5U34)-methyltransferase